MISLALSVFLATVLLAAVPLLAVMTAFDPRLRELPRSAIYTSAVASQWILAALGVAVVALSGPSLRQLGFQELPGGEFARWTLFLVGVTAAAYGIMLVLEQWGLWPDESDLVKLLMPRTRREKIWCVLVLAPTAAIAEEFLYRGYLMHQLAVWFHSPTAGWVLSSGAFGMAHAYQRVSGVARAALLGALLAYPVLRTGSLYPSMAAHLIVDAISLAWLGPYLLAKEEEKENRL
jgi:CAAX protease family protein